METINRNGFPVGKAPVNPEALNKLLGQMVNDLGAAVNGALVVLGDGLGIYKALAEIALGFDGLPFTLFFGADAEIHCHSHLRRPHFP